MTKEDLMKLLENADMDDNVFLWDNNTESRFEIIGIEVEDHAIDVVFNGNIKMNNEISYFDNHPIAFDC